MKLYTAYCILYSLYPFICYPYQRGGKKKGNPPIYFSRQIENSIAGQTRNQINIRFVIIKIIIQNIKFNVVEMWNAYGNLQSDV